MNAAKRTQRRHDLLLAADVLRRQIDASLTSLQPTVEPALHGLAIGRWLRRHAAAPRTWVVLAWLAAAGAAVGGSGIGRFALRHRKALRRAWIVWRLMKLLPR